MLQFLIGEAIAGKVHPGQIGTLRLHKMRLREVLLHKCAHIFHVSGQILQKLIHPPRAFGIHGFHGNLPHNVSLTVARRRIRFPVSFPELLVLDDDVCRLKSCHVKGFAW